jgi:hypothetical protein
MLDESVTGRNAQDSLALKDIAEVVADAAAEELQTVDRAHTW